MTYRFLIGLLLVLSPILWADDNLLKNHASDRIDELEYDRDELANKSMKKDKKIPVCEVIAKKLKRLSRKKWTYRQLSPIAKNPANKPDALAKEAIKKFKDKPRLSSTWYRNEEGFYYFRQIKAERKCLHCHNSAPSKFKDGKLVGVFSAFKKDKK